ncbi:MAG: hypothetical protein A4E71_00123 [Smithella sp. PtaU1.Bin162]|nr:MAG: hypothetical protein A4E71_00123 [Smithella sp. PtaU1.Bin162]
MKPKKKSMMSKKAITPDCDILSWDKFDNLTENEKTNIFDSYHFFTGFYDHEYAKGKNLTARSNCILAKGKPLTSNDFRGEKEFEIAALKRELNDMKIFLKTFIEKEGIASIDYFCIPEIEEWHVNIYALDDFKKICKKLSNIKAFDGIYTRVKRVLENLKLSPKTEKKLTQDEIDRIVKEVIKYNTEGKQLIVGPSFNLRLISEINSLINFLEEGSYLKLSWCLFGFFRRYYNFIYDKYDKELLEIRPKFAKFTRCPSEVRLLALKRKAELIAAGKTSRQANAIVQAEFENNPTCRGLFKNYGTENWKKLLQPIKTGKIEVSR